jgi:hypothetical protein
MHQAGAADTSEQVRRAAEQALSHLGMTGLVDAQTHGRLNELLAELSATDTAT